MSLPDTILAAFAGPDEELTTDEMRTRTGIDITRLCTQLFRLRGRGLVERVDPDARPVKHRLAGAARTRALLMARKPVPLSEDVDGSILASAKRQPVSVFDLGRTL